MNINHEWIPMLQPKKPEQVMFGSGMLFHFELGVTVKVDKMRPIVVKDFKHRVVLDEGTRNQATMLVDIKGLGTLY